MNLVIFHPLYINSWGRGFNPRRGRQHSFVEVDHEIFSTVIPSLPLIQEEQLSVSGERMRTILVNRLEDQACPVNVWLGKLTVFDMTPMGWLGRKTSTQTKHLLWVQLLLQFCTDYYEILLVFFFFKVWGCACDLDVIFIYLFFFFFFFYFFFFSLFLHCELSHFSPSIYRQWVPLEHKAS